MYLIPADRLHVSPFMTREPAIWKHMETVKKRNHHNPYAEAIKIRKHHPCEEWLKMRQKMDEADLRKKERDECICRFLKSFLPTGQAIKVSPPPPPPPPPTPQKKSRGTQTAVTSASVTASPPPPPIKKFKYEPPKEDRVEENDDDEEDDYDDDGGFVEDEAREYGRENVGPVASPYLMPYVYKGRFLHTQYCVRNDFNIFMIGDSPIVVDTSGDITIKDRVFKGSKGL